MIAYRAALTVLCGASIAAASPVVGSSSPTTTEEAPRHFESPQRFALELKFTPYSPHIDRSAGLRPGETPFADLFNGRTYDAAGALTNKGAQPSYRLLTSVEFDVQFLRRAYGNFGVGITTGFYRRTTHGFELSPDGTRCDLATCSRSGDETALNIIPLTALFVYRFDLLANRYHIPLVPYFKIGLAYYVWFIQNGDGSIASYPRPTATNAGVHGESAYGGSFGFVLNPGIALQLDFIERGVARNMDGETGINHTYLFCELSYANVNGFGASNKLDLSDTMLNAGFAIEF